MIYKVVLALSLAMCFGLVFLRVLNSCNCREREEERCDRIREQERMKKNGPKRREKIARSMEKEDKECEDQSKSPEHTYVDMEGVSRYKTSREEGNSQATIPAEERGEVSPARAVEPDHPKGVIEGAKKKTYVADTALLEQRRKKQDLKDRVREKGDRRVMYCSTPVGRKVDRNTVRPIRRTRHDSWASECDEMFGTPMSSLQTSMETRPVKTETVRSVSFNVKEPIGINTLGQRSSPLSPVPFPELGPTFGQLNSMSRDPSEIGRERQLEPVAEIAGYEQIQPADDEAGSGLGAGNTSMEAAYRSDQSDTSYLELAGSWAGRPVSCCSMEVREKGKCSPSANKGGQVWPDRYFRPSHFPRVIGWRGDVYVMSAAINFHNIGNIILLYIHSRGGRSQQGTSGPPGVMAAPRA